MQDIVGDKMKLIFDKDSEIKLDPIKWHINHVAYRSTPLAQPEINRLDIAKLAAATLAPIVQAYI